MTHVIRIYAIRANWLTFNWHMGFLSHARGSTLKNCDLVTHSTNFIYTINLRLRHVSYTLNRECQVVGNQYSRLLFTSEDQVCANLRVQEQSTCTSRSHDVVDQLWWRHNVKLEKVVLGDNGEVSKRWLFWADFVIHGNPFLILYMFVIL